MLCMMRVCDIGIHRPSTSERAMQLGPHEPAVEKMELPLRVYKRIVACRNFRYGQLPLLLKVKEPCPIIRVHEFIVQLRVETFGYIPRKGHYIEEATRRSSFTAGVATYMCSRWVRVAALIVERHCGDHGGDRCYHQESNNAPCCFAK
jgi:hypothetical protein